MCKKFHIVTLGCQKNEYDSQLIASLLTSMGYERTDKPEESSTLVINTCCIRNKADVKAYGRLGQYRTLNESNPDLITIVAGCLAQKDGKKLLSRFKNVNLVVGPRNIGRLPELIDFYQRTGKRRAVCDLSEMNFDIISPVRDRVFSGWIPIAEGCDCRCTYCIVPYVRGSMISRKPESIIKEAEDFAASGGLEITLLGQNVNAYGKDCESYGNFGTLLQKINDIPGIRRIRFMSPHPSNFSNEFIETMASLDKVAKHVHLPLQSGDNVILRRMNRRYSVEDYAAVVAKLRKEIADIAITTDIIVGFPGETESQFENTMDFVREMNFDGAFMFAYSEREGTPAVKITPSVPPEERLIRLRSLIETQNSVTLEKHKRYEGVSAEVLVETVSKKDPEFLTGKTSRKSVVNFRGRKELVGQIINVKLVKAFTWGFMGELE